MRSLLAKVGAGSGQYEPLNDSASNASNINGKASPSSSSATSSHVNSQSLFPPARSGDTWSYQHQCYLSDLMRKHQADVDAYNAARASKK